MIPIKLLGISYQLPERWDEVTVRQFIGLMDRSKDIAGNPALILSILSGIDYDVLMNADPRQIEGDILAHLTFLGNDVGLESFEKSETIEINGTRYVVPTDLQNETWGQKITAQMIINEAAAKKMPLISIASELVAVYLQPVINGPFFDDKKMKPIADQIRNTSKISEVWPVAAFFLRKSIKSAIQNPKPLHLNPKPKKFKLGWRSSKRSEL